MTSERRMIAVTFHLELSAKPSAASNEHSPGRTGTAAFAPLRQWFVPHQTRLGAQSAAAGVTNVRNAGSSDPRNSGGPETPRHAKRELRRIAPAMRAAKNGPSELPTAAELLRTLRVAFDRSLARHRGRVGHGGTVVTRAL